MIFIIGALAAILLSLRYRKYRVLCLLLACGCCFWLLFVVMARDAVDSPVAEVYARCSDLLSSEPSKVKENVLAGVFDPNRKCCDEGMIDECWHVTEQNRNRLPLSFAVSYHNAALISALIAVGAKTDYPGALAEGADSLEMIKLLLPYHQTEEEHLEALAQAASLRNKEVYEYLLTLISEGKRAVASEMAAIGLSKSIIKALEMITYDEPLPRILDGLQFAEAEKIPVSTEIFSELLCEIIPRAVLGSGELRSRSARVISFLRSKPLLSNYRCSLMAEAPLWLIVARAGDVELLTMLFQQGADVQARDLYGNIYVEVELAGLPRATRDLVRARYELGGVGK